MMSQSPRHRQWAVALLIGATLLTGGQVQSGPSPTALRRFLAVDNSSHVITVVTDGQTEVAGPCYFGAGTRVRIYGVRQGQSTIRANRIEMLD
ncbi:hypothetical protein TPY_1781 [Sulfobacillus acidophilus TPY]|nr:hypothetical protein TPY_1781 [Sulfobacillus acidophilus TPY]MCY0864701.1 hypothetical protein [Sulfobacillus sp.]